MYSHHCCNLLLPLISRVSRRPICFSHRFSSKSIHLLQAEHNIGRKGDNKVLTGKPSVGNQNGVSSSFSSWEKSADAYFSKNGGLKLREQQQQQEEEDLVSESADSTRLNRTKANHKDFTYSRSRSEKSVVHRRNKQEFWDQTKWKESTEKSSVPKMVGQCVYGIAPVMAALTAARREFYALYIQEGLEFTANNKNKKKKKKEKKGVDNILNLAKKLGLRIIESSKHDLNMAADNRPHQGLILDASPLEIVDIRELEPVEAKRDQRSPLWVALDEVTDPQNLGAIIRSAYFFGAQGVVICARNSAPLSGVVGKASAGCLEIIELRSCDNMMKFLESSMENGWRVVGGSVSSKAVDLREVEAGVPTVLVLGSEGYGLRPLVERCCSQLIRINGRMSVDDEGEEMDFFLAVESLNVSVAAGVLLYHLVGDGKDFSVEKMKGISS